jgi:hypothetical protein
MAAALCGPRGHLKPAVIVALGTGMRFGEQLRMKRSQVEFLSNIVSPDILHPLPITSYFLRFIIIECGFFWSRIGHLKELWLEKCRL